MTKYHHHHHYHHFDQMNQMAFYQMSEKCKLQLQRWKLQHLGHNLGGAFFRSLQSIVLYIYRYTYTLLPDTLYKYIYIHTYIYIYIYSEALVWLIEYINNNVINIHKFIYSKKLIFHCILLLIDVYALMSVFFPLKIKLSTVEIYYFINHCIY